MKTPHAVALGFILLVACAWMFVGWSGGPAEQGQSATTAPIVRAAGEPPRAVMMLAQAPAPPTPPLATPDPAPAAPAEPAPATPAPEPIAEAAPPAGGALPVVDETALRYFARQGDTVRLDREIARLQALYPDWQPPEDFFADPAVTDPALDRLWQLYAQGDFGALRRAIAERTEAEPGWTPPDDLMQRLTLGEERERLLNASDAGQSATVLRIAAERPSLLICAEVDILWRVAEAFARTDRPDRAFDAYRYILENCDNPAERLATVQKALPLVDRADLERLITIAEARGDGNLAGIRDDLVRQSVGAGSADADADVPAADVAALEVLAEGGDGASDALLLGWYRYLRGDNDAAEGWFRMAMEREASAVAAQGLALTLIARDDPLAAEAELYPFRDAEADTKAVYMAAAANLVAGATQWVLQREAALDEVARGDIVAPGAADPRDVTAATDPATGTASGTIDAAARPPAPIDPDSIGADVLARVVAEAATERDPATAQQLGWYAYVLQQDGTAADWFATALRWKPEDEPSAYGLALARYRLGDDAAVAAIQAQWGAQSVRIRQLGEDRTPVREAPRQSEAVAPAETRPAAVADRAPTATGSGGGGPRGDCSTTARVATLAPAAALTRGWCLLDLDRPLEAAEAFGVAMTSTAEGVRRDAAWGQSLAYLRAGLTNDAAVAATQAPQDAERVSELSIAILSQRATSAFDNGRFNEALLALDERARLTPETTDLMVLRGYAYFELGRTADARQVFDAAAATGNREALRGAALIRDAARRFQ
jgi:tetratricopeptide (TPR) repeat protein